VTVTIDHIQSHTHLVSILWIRDRPVENASTWTKHIIYKRKTSMPPVVFKPANPASEWPQKFVSLW